ncbi:MAG: hypothetical protein WCL56_07825 [Sediminibacterium sp.]
MPRKFWVGLAIILIIYTAYYLLFMDTHYVTDIPRKIRHVIKFTVLFTVYLIGVKQLTLEKIAWMKTIWHVIHLSGIFILLSLGAFDWIVRPLPFSVRQVMGAINEFLIGPTLFVGMGILHQFLLKNETL